MDRRGFWRGLFTGGIIGALVAMFLAPRTKSGSERMMERGRELREKAEETLKKVKENVDSFLRKQKTE